MFLDFLKLSFKLSHLFENTNFFFCTKPRIEKEDISIHLRRFTRLAVSSFENKAASKEMVAISRLICRRIGESIIRFFPRKIEFRFDLAPYEIERFFGYFCINRQKYPSGADEAVVLRVERTREMT